MKLIVPKMMLCLASAAGCPLVLATAYGQGPSHDILKTETAPSGAVVNKGEEGVAVKGYDVVSYFDQK